MEALTPLQSPELELRSVCAGGLEPVSLTIAAGEIVCLSGPSGSGKSRLLRAIADLDPHQGEILLGQVAQQSLSADCWRRWVTLVPADSQWWADTVGAHFDRTMLAELEVLGFAAETLDWSISRLSSGEKQRLALIRALCHKPRALLLDEPTANLDPELTERVEQWLVTLARSQQLPLLWVAHDPAQIQRVADRHYRIAGNRLEPV